jgi:hypothetical protein
MSVDTWEQMIANQHKEWLEAALRAWPRYKGKKPIDQDSFGEEKRLEFLDGVTDTNKAVRTKTTTFFFKKGEKTPYMVKSNTRKSQRFLVVSGPEAGSRLIDDDKEYVLFNRNGRYGKDVPKCVLVHRSSLKS